MDICFGQNHQILNISVPQSSQVLCITSKTKPFALDTIRYDGENEANDDGGQHLFERQPRERVANIAHYTTINQSNGYDEQDLTLKRCDGEEGSKRE